MKLDILVLAAHPDDAELGCGGTIAAHVSKGKKVGIVDLTRGELGTRGTPETRIEEANRAAKILGLAARENIGLEDGFFETDKKHCLQVIKVIRKYKPEIIITNAPEDRHPDHGNAGKLCSRSSFLSGLIKIETVLEGKSQEAWRPKALFHFIQDRYLKPDFVMDVTDFWNSKMESIKAYESQFYNPNSEEPETYISSAGFMQFVESRAHEVGHSIGVKFGEGFIKEKQLFVKSFFDII